MLARFPTQPTHFVGRVRELAEIAARLADPDCRLLTLTGGGGSGKSRLAIEASRAGAASFADGALFVALQPVDETDLLVPTIAHAAGFSFYRPDDVQTQLFDYLHDRSMILLLDNFEHLLDGAGLVGDILAHAPGVKIIVTSREALNLQEEWLYPIKGLEIPHSVYSTALEDYEAVQLFVDLARRVQPNFDLAETREAVVRIVQISGGLPLAIALAVSWLKGLSLVDIAREMQHNLDFLSTTTRNVEERHRSIRAAFDQSWTLLSDDERRTFARLSVFRGGFGRKAAEEVAGATLPTLASLVEKSLLNPQLGGRWDVHELLRQYGEERLVEQGMADHTRAAHSRYYSGFMQQCETALKSPAQLDILDDIERDFENIRIGWGWAIRTRDYSVIDQMLESLYQFGLFRNRIREMVELFEHALKLPLDDRLRGRLLVRRWGYLHWSSPPDPDEVVRTIEQALDTAAAVGDKFEVALCKLMLGHVWVITGENTRAADVLKESLALFRQIDESFHEAWVLHRVAFASMNLGDMGLARDATEQSLALARSVPNHFALATCLYNLAAFDLVTGNYERGEKYCKEAMLAILNLGHKGQIAMATSLLAFAAFFRGDFVNSRRLADDAWHLGEEVFTPRIQAYPLSLLTLHSCMDEDYREARRLAGLIDTSETNALAFEMVCWSRAVLACGLQDRAGARSHIREALSMALRGKYVAIELGLLPAAAFVLADEQPAQAARLLAWFDASADSATLWAKRWPLVDRVRGDLRVRLGVTTFEAEYDRGEALTWPEILSALASEFDAAPGASPLSGLDEPLTQRELEVLNLLAAGLTNSEIAERLVIGLGTVKTHAQNIYGKLEVGNRTQAIVRAREIGLLVQ